MKMWLLGLTGVVCSVATAQPVQWRVEDGGNGHWYEMVQSGSGDWNAHASVAQAAGGYLATLTSTEENSWVKSQVVLPTIRPGFGPYLGGRREVGTGWHWITGEPWGFTAWGGGEPSGDGFHLHFYLSNDLVWNDCGGCTSSSVIEWSADCNNDGLVDYGQILSGELVDANNDGVPDSLTITTQPTDQSVGVDVPVSFFVEVAAVTGCTDPITYQWQRRDPLVADPNAANAWIGLADGGGFVNSHTSALLITRPTPGLATGFRCKIGRGCGCDTSNERFIFTNEVNFSVACPADFNADGGVDFQDVEAFFQRWENGC